VGSIRVVTLASVRDRLGAAHSDPLGPPGPCVPHAPTQLRGEVPALGYLDPVEFEPRLHLPELGGQLRDHAARVLCGYAPKRASRTG